MNPEENQKKQKTSILGQNGVEFWFVELKSKYAVESITEGYSDDDEEDLKDYRVGGYHPVEVVMYGCWYGE